MLIRRAHMDGAPGGGLLRLLVGGLVISSTAACSDRTEAPPGPSFAVVADEVELDPRTQALFFGEAEFVAIAEEEPTFAGYYVEDGRLVVRSTDQLRKGPVGQVVRDRLVAAAAGDERVTPLRYEVEHRDAQFSFRQLAHWRNTALEGLTLEGLVSLDLDEVANLVRIGVEGIGDAASVTRALSELGVPSEAVAVEVRAQPRFNQSLDDHVRPMIAGLQIDIHDNAGRTGGCTLGVNARVPSGAYVVVTASHCTRTMWGMDYTGTTAFQQIRNPPSLSNQFGVEYRDPQSWSCWFIGWYNCRRSDAALFTNTLPAGDVGFSLIARTTFSSAGNIEGSRIIDATDSVFVITGAINHPWHGMEANKMGRDGGWTVGNVDETCVALVPGVGLFPGSTRVLCSYHTTYRSDQGDSGGPVFTWDGQGDNVAFAGINFASDGEWENGHAGTGWFSSWYSVRTELGPLQIFNEPLQSVQITGPLEAPVGEACTWYGTNVTGGVWPFSYQWSGAMSGGGTSVTGEIQEPGEWLYLTVTDGLNNQVSTQMYIPTDEWAFGCMY